MDRLLLPRVQKCVLWLQGVGDCLAQELHPPAVGAWTPSGRMLLFGLQYYSTIASVYHHANGQGYEAPSACRATGTATDSGLHIVAQPTARFGDGILCQTGAQGAECHFIRRVGCPCSSPLRLDSLERKEKRFGGGSRPQRIEMTVRSTLRRIVALSLSNSRPRSQRRVPITLLLSLSSPEQAGRDCNRQELRRHHYAGRSAVRDRSRIRYLSILRHCGKPLFCAGWWYCIVLFLVKMIVVGV